MADRPQIDPALISKVATLARLELTDAEVEQTAVELERVLVYVAKLSELDTEAVAPTAHAIALATVWRDDEVLPGLSVERGLSNAPETLGGAFVVPRPIE